MSYEAWRITYQSSEQAARAAYGEAVALYTKLKEMEDRLFALGAMEEAPCFCCGYNGPDYFQPTVHSCAVRHHALTKNKEES